MGLVASEGEDGAFRGVVLVAVDDELAAVDGVGDAPGQQKGANFSTFKAPYLESSFHSVSELIGPR